MMNIVLGKLRDDDETDIGLICDFHLSLQDEPPNCRVEHV